MYEKLFTPMYIGTLKVKNRFCVPAMDSHYTDTNHQFTQQALNYYGEKARGGFGLITTEFMCVSEEGLAEATQAGIYNDSFIPMLSRLTQRVHEEGAVMIAQLQHSGRRQGKGTSEYMPVGPSYIVPNGGNREIHELTTEEVQVIIQKFVDAAIRAKKANFDGVEIHGAHGYLLADFLSKSANKRVDQYGGNITNRARIVCEIVKKVKEACGKDYPVIVRSGGVEEFYGGNDIEDVVCQCMLFEEAGADCVNVSYDAAIQSYYKRPGFNIENVRKVTEVLTIPVMGVGRINDPTLALYCIKSGAMDFVCLGRESLADPHLPNKVKEGRLNEIITCVGCMQRCLYSDSFEEGWGTSCMLNPFTGKESKWVIEPTATPKNIAVVGAGVAGLQAAWILGKKGHHVTVFEKDHFAGGQYRLASVPSMKQDLAKVVSTYLSFCKNYNVEIKYNTLATKEMLVNYDEVIIATGANPVVPRFIDMSQDNIYLANDVLSYKKIVNNEKVLVLGAGLVGVECAEVLAERGNKVTVVDMLDKAAPLAPYRPRMNLLSHCDDLGIDFRLNSKVLKINQDGIDYENNNEVHTLSNYTSIILAFGSRSNTALYDSFENKEHVYTIGDASKAGDAKKAIYEATKLALSLD